MLSLYLQTIPIWTSQIPLMCFIKDSPFSLILLLFFPLPGFSISVVEEDGVQQLYITDVKAGGLAFAKGTFPFYIFD